MTQDINGATRLICLFGDPVAHSKSPHLHNRAFERAGLNYAYMAFRVPGEDMKQATDAIRLLNMRGCNLTMPNKIAVIPFLDKLDPIAEMVGAVNTIVNEDGMPIFKKMVKLDAPQVLAKLMSTGFVCRMPV